MVTVIFICILFVLSSKSDAATNNDSVAALIKIEEYPFVAQVCKKEGGNLSCGLGCIIDKRWILTTALLVHETPQPFVRVGSNQMHRGKNITVEKVIQHELFNPVWQDNDIALLRLREEIPFNETVGKVVLAQNDSLGNVEAITIGFGLVNDTGRLEHYKYLRMIQLPILDEEQCAQDRITQDAYETENSTLCALDRSNNSLSCLPELGGPLLLKNVGENKFTLIGVFTYGMPNCKIWPVRKPGYFSRISYYYPWITGTIANYSAPQREIDSVHRKQ